MVKDDPVIIHKNANGFTLHQWGIGIGIGEQEKLVFNTVDQLVEFLRGHFAPPNNACNRAAEHRFAVDGLCPECQEPLRVLCINKFCGLYNQPPATKT